METLLLLLKFWLTPEALATYLVGILAIFGVAWHLKRTFVLSKKADVFNELSNDIKQAIELVNKVDTETASIIQLLATAANNASYYNANATDQENQKEIERRLNELDKIGDSQVKHINVIYGSYQNILGIIQKIEQSTVTKKSSKRAARYLFYQADEQFQLIQSSSKVLQSFNVVPPLGDKPNISSDTFNAFSGLVSLIGAGNRKTANYLSDLQAILHNDLVRKLYKKARSASIPVQHLTTDGFKDSRTEKSTL